MTILLAYTAGLAVIAGICLIAAGLAVATHIGDWQPHGLTVAAAGCTVLAAATWWAGLWHAAALATAAAVICAGLAVDASRAAARRRTAQHLYLPRHTARRTR